MAHADVRLPQGTIRYSDTGEAPGATIVFLHGLLVDGNLWDGVVGHLDGHRCIVPELPLGSHLTPMRADADLTPPGLAGLVADFIEALGLSDVVLVANDTAGAIAQLVVTDRPERVGGLVLTSCEAFDRFPPPALRPFVWAARSPRAIGAVFQALRLRAVQRLFLAVIPVTAEPIPKPQVDAWFRPARVDADVRRDLCKVMRAADSRHTMAAAERLPSFGRPALVVWAAGDRLCPPADGQRLAQLLDAPFEELDDCATLLPLEQPERLAGHIDRFCARVATSA